MEELKEELKLDHEVGVFVIDIGDYASVEAAVTQTKVVINTIGPFWTYGDHVVRCVHFSTILRAGAYIPVEPVQVMGFTTSTWLESLISSKQ